MSNCLIEYDGTMTDDLTNLGYVKAVVGRCGAMVRHITSLQAKEPSSASSAELN